MSHVYIIQSGKDGPYKIGMARNVEKRLDELQIGNPQKLYIIAKIYFGTDARAYHIEKQLHRMYSRARIRGEWFNKTIQLKRADSYLNADFFDQKENKALVDDAEWDERELIASCPF